MRIFGNFNRIFNKAKYEITHPKSLIYNAALRLSGLPKLTELPDLDSRFGPRANLIRKYIEFRFKNHPWISPVDITNTFKYLMPKADLESDPNTDRLFFLSLEIERKIQNKIKISSREKLSVILEKLKTAFSSLFRRQSVEKKAEQTYYFQSDLAEGPVYISNETKFIMVTFLDLMSLPEDYSIVFPHFNKVPEIEIDQLTSFPTNTNDTRREDVNAIRMFAMERRNEGATSVEIMNLLIEQCPGLINESNYSAAFNLLDSSVAQVDRNKFRISIN
ncbi:MAG: hypothetical protein SFU25_08820 [Candidatus Caenarcaniphilales bacterium]|nr:hypothetical protein [Candidatus Caenarcaniphilales bacterium]